MIAHLRRWLLACLLGPDAYALQPVPVQPGDHIMLRAKNHERTGNTPKRVEVLAVTVRYTVEARYRDGSTSAFVFTPERLIEAKQEAARG